MLKTRHYKILMVFFGLVAAVALLLALYFLPPVHNRLWWRVSILRANIYNHFNPPDEAIFIPGQQEEMSASINLTPTATEPPPTATLVPSPTPTNYIPPTPTETATPTPSPTPIPSAVKLEGVRYERQSFNNCGPANLSMALSFWGWEGDQKVTADWLKPNPLDRNVMPYEMVEYVRTQTNLNAILRWGGDLEMIKTFIAAGFPVLIERGYLEEIAQYGWMGHYNVITGYDDNRQAFIVQDSYAGSPDTTNSYERIERHWRAFNYVFIIVYSPDREAEVLTLLGPHADESYNLQHAAEKAQDEINVLSERELFFAWNNYGTSLVNLFDYYSAAQAFDRAFEVYADISPRPYRLFWYSTGAYFAYYYTGRYQDVIDLADMTLSLSPEPAIEETWVWRGRAKRALGDVDGAIRDFREALKWHPGWWVAENELRNLGITP
jgi:tetratricopeptide (TPR) repeat protein